MALDFWGRRWREKPLAQRLAPACVYLGLAVVSLTSGIWCWSGVEGTPLDRTRVVAIVLWIMTPGLAGLAVQSRRLRQRW